ncbi:MAG: NADH-quinone oxidoreductase subunit M [Pseudomonadota bacterium]
MDNLVSILIFTPLLAALILAIFLRGDDDAARQNAKWLALTATGATFAIALALFVGFDPDTIDFQFVESRPALFGLSYRVGVDGLSLGFIMLVTALMPIAVGASWMLTDRVKAYVIALLSFETLILGAITSLDLVFFAFFFEASFIPLLFLAGLWGGKGSGVVALKSWLYTLPGTILLIIALTMIAREAGTSDVTALLRHNFSTDGGGWLPGGGQSALWLMIAASVAVKLALWPLHTWLPGLAAKAPLAVGLLAACLLTKLGLYGFMRLLISMLPKGTEALAPYIMALAGIGLLLGALAAFSAAGLGRLLGYLAVAHSGFLTLVLMAQNVVSFDAVLMAALGGSFALAGLFAMAGMLEERARSREIAAFGALKQKMPVMAAFFAFFALAAFGLPGTASFVGLFLSVIGVIQASLGAAVVLSLGALLIAACGLLLHRRIMLGGLIKESFKILPDLQGRERMVLSLLVGMTVVLGIWPGLMLERTGPSFAALAEMFAALP